LRPTPRLTVGDVLDKTIHGDVDLVLDYLPEGFVDLVFVDPPYNLDKVFNSTSFKAKKDREYTDWLEGWLGRIVRLLKPSSSIYICGDWRSSSAIFDVASRHFKVRNRITWEREKGRGAKSNWKNCSEDIWFCTMSDDYYFNVDAVMSKRQVIAPYRDSDGNPRDWQDETDGKFRLSHPSNLWTDMTVQFWSMPENTEHPTQKPEKLVAKVILASSRQGDVVLDPFLGSGTTSVVAQKLGLRYVGVDSDEYYCCRAEKRLEAADHDRSIQGYNDGVFWERNTAARKISKQCGELRARPGHTVSDSWLTGPAQAPITNLLRV